VGLIEDYLDRKRQAPQTVWLLADENGAAVGARRLTPGWHSPPGGARTRRACRRGGVQARIGSGLLGALRRLAEGLGAPTLEVEVRGDDAGSLAWPERRGFREIGRSVRLAVDLTAIEEPPVDPPGHHD
jgi:hypothetical protein